MSSTDYIAAAAQYQAGVLDGSIPVCEEVRRACDRNRRDLARQATPMFPYRFDPEAATRICRMAELLPHIKGEKARIVGTDDEGRQLWATIALEPWQCWILTTLFGWVRVADGYRRFRSGLILVPRKNAKSTIGAIVALYMLTADGESGAECYSAATSRDQAKVVAEIAWEMARRSPQFRDHFGVKMGSKTSLSLSVPVTGAKFMPLSADAHSLDGLNVSFAIVDELHAHKTRAVWDVLDTATGARRQPLLLAITTAGVEVDGICAERLGYLRRILDGTIPDESTFGVNYTIDPTDDYWLPETARKANPNYGVSVDPEDIARKMLAARHSSSMLNDKLTKHFNVWIRSVAGWMTAAVWQTCTVASLSIETLRGYPCWIGVDLGEVRDYSACVLVFQIDADTFAVIPRIYIPEEAIAQAPSAALAGQVRDGWAIATPGAEADYQRIEDDLIGWHHTLNVQEIDFDRRSARLMIQKIKQRLEPEMGRDRVDLYVLDIPQSLETMDPAMKLTERLVSAKKLQHDGNTLMASMIANVVIERNHKDEMYPRKAGGKDSPHKIDGPVAMWTALSRARLGPAPTNQFQLVVLRRQ